MTPIIEFLKGRKTMSAGLLGLGYLAMCIVNDTDPNVIWLYADIILMIMFLRDGMAKKK